MPQLNLSAKDAVILGQVDPDRYRVKITGIGDVQEGKEHGTPYVNAETVIIEGVETGDKFAGQRLWRNLPLAGKGAGFFIQFWNAAFADDEDLQINVEEAKEQDSLNVDTDDLIGREVYFICKEKEFPKGSGEYRTEVDRVLPL